MNGLVNSLSTCCGYRQEPLLSEKNQNRVALALKVTAFAVSVLLLTAAILASLQNLGFLAGNSKFAFFNHVGQFGSGVALAATAITSAALLALLLKGCCEKTKKKDDTISDEETESRPVIRRNSQEDIQIPQPQQNQPPQQKAKGGGMFSWGNSNQQD